ncbi:unnamed protein product [Rotaria sp. Silwood2]|nr:unnamed protein product [Rotaria sp. Silwood2]CAF3287728.1 unnamed protein product [Rotaria sp. Silwood2]CAF3403750.1 unnamed protein product [Rotaria sp. Silwood2]CAF4164011.1 unnamed protein product [Rotaria sp. Silwood2]CAF4309998.1 unnamed protein product [Rotaria sp. Silwood2]
MCSSNQSIIEFLHHATIQLNHYLSIIIYLFGTIGNILSIIILSQKKFRSNSCAFLFLTSSIASLIAILSGLTNRIITGWTVDLTSTINWLCQLRAMVLFTSRMIALWLITLATIDRWLLSCADVRRRQMRTLKKAKLYTIIIVIFSILFNTPIIYCFEANVIGTPVECYGKTAACRIYTDMIYGCGTILVPSLVMTYFSIMIIWNVRGTRRRVEIFNITTNHARRQRRTKKKDRQLLIMLLVQVTFIVLLTFPQAIQKLYTTITLALYSSVKSALQTAIEEFTFNFVVNLTYIASGLPFYIYTLSGGNVFRNACWHFIRMLSRKITCRNNAI